MPDREALGEVEKRIDSWRQEMLAHLGSPDLVEELESHLREAIECRLQIGVEPINAWEESQMELGSPQSLGQQFAVVAKPQLWLPNRVFLGLWVLGMALGLLVLVPLVAAPRIQHDVQDLGVHPSIALWLRVHVLSLMAGYWTITALGGLATWFLLARQMQPFLPGQLVSVSRWLIRGNITVLGFLAFGIVAGMFWSASVLGAYWNHDIKEYACLAVCFGTLVVVIWGYLRPANPALLASATMLNVTLALWSFFGPHLVRGGLHGYGEPGLILGQMAIATIVLGGIAFLGFLPARALNWFTNRQTLA